MIEKEHDESGFGFAASVVEVPLDEQGEMYVVLVSEVACVPVGL